MSAFKKILKNLTPPIFWNFAKNLREVIKNTEPEWEYVPEGWEAAIKNRKIRGWNQKSVIELYEKKWPEFLKSLEGVKPLGVSHEAASTDRESLRNHNLIMSFAYVLGIASWQKKRISLLDWGGGIGHYYLIAKTLHPNLDLDYTSKDTAVMCEAGPRFLTKGVRFDPTEDCLNQKYDLVMASTSLHYSQDWKKTLKKLALAGSPYLYLTRLPIVKKVPSYVMLQRAYNYGYNTEYLGWCVNETEFLNTALASGLKLIREFVVGERSIIHNAPEECEYRGYLFKR